MPDADPRTVLAAARTIAVVGLSDDPRRPSHDVASDLQRAGFRIIPVNPTLQEVLGERCYPTLAEVPEPIDLVDVFRRPEYCADVARDAVAAGARALWLQSGIRSAAARQIAGAAGIDYVEDSCTKVVRRLYGITPREA